MSKIAVKRGKFRNALKFSGICLLVMFFIVVSAVSVSWALDVWDGNVADRYEGGDGTSAAPYLIKTGAQLTFLAQNVNSGTSYEGRHFKLVDDIDLAGREWTPIGHREKGTPALFSAVFDGGGYTISNMRINMSPYGGLFAQTGAGSTVKDLHLTKVDIDVTPMTTSYAGGVAGSNSGAIIGCTSEGGISSSTSFTSYAGGIVGYNSGGTVTDCTSKANVTSSFYAGGIVGYNSGAVINCTSSGSVASSFVHYASFYAGGIVGVNSGRVSGCGATGKVSATNTGFGSAWAGGVVGRCYNRGVVFGNTFDAAGTGQRWGIARDERISPLGSSNNGAEPNDGDAKTTQAMTR
jgi:hypothetical protein